MEHKTPTYTVAGKALTSIKKRLPGMPQPPMRKNLAIGTDFFDIGNAVDELICRETFGVGLKKGYKLKKAEESGGKLEFLKVEMDSPKWLALSVTLKYDTSRLPDPFIARLTSKELGTASGLFDCNSYNLLDNIKVNPMPRLQSMFGQEKIVFSVEFTIGAGLPERYESKLVEILAKDAMQNISFSLDRIAGAITVEAQQTGQNAKIFQRDDGK